MCNQINLIEAKIAFLLLGVLLSAIYVICHVLHTTFIQYLYHIGTRVCTHTISRWLYNHKFISTTNVRQIRKYILHRYLVHIVLYKFLIIIKWELKATFPKIFL